jgi:PTH1 family peptidyl-tRNA hydrolase
MKSIVNSLANDKFPRVRVGIGKPVYEEDIINYVIGLVPDEELTKLDKGVQKAKEAIVEILKNGIDSAMNKFN